MVFGGAGQGVTCPRRESSRRRPTPRSLAGVHPVLNAGQIYLGGGIAGPDSDDDYPYEANDHSANADDPGRESPQWANTV